MRAPWLMVGHALPKMEAVYVELSQHCSCAGTVELSEAEFDTAVDLGGAGKVAASSSGADYALRVSGPVFQPGCFGQYLEERLTLIDTRGYQPPPAHSALCPPRAALFANQQSK